MNQSEKIDLLVQALVKVQAGLQPVQKTSQGYNYKYADLVALDAIVRPLLSANGLAVIQTGGIQGDKATLVTTLAHTSGQWMRGEIPLANAKPNDSQAQGSAITYSRRYGLMAIIGVVASDEDEDGDLTSKNRMELKDVTKTAAPATAAFGGKNGF